MSDFFKPYEGNRPFLFISYAHRQSDKVLDTIRILHEKGWRLWYDEGILPGSDWPANIARHMQSCERVIFFLSARALESQNCYSEIKTAYRQGKPILLVRLEDTAPDEKWTEVLNGCPEIPLIDSAPARAEAILRSGFLPRRLHRNWAERIPWRALGLIVSLLFFLSAAFTLGALASGKWNPIQVPEIPVETPDPRVTPTTTPTPVPVIDLGGAERYFAVSFPDTQQERAIRRALDNPSGEIYHWQIAEITDLYFCGNLSVDDPADVSFEMDGTCRVNGAPVIQGQVSDLRLIGSMVRLERLALICQPLDDLSALKGHLFLQELSLAGSRVDNISALIELPGLETLHLEHTAVRDLTPLEALPKLKTVTVSRDMLPLKWNEEAAFAVVLVREY
ncbi:MAG: TIR domain-containing protein [Oscillospiraceae bacterium]|nr:TIR domain-containing protein [Oscillospiraceae bacterium]